MFYRLMTSPWASLIAAGAFLVFLGILRVCIVLSARRRQRKAAHAKAPNSTIPPTRQKAVQSSAPDLETQVRRFFAEAERKLIDELARTGVSEPFIIAAPGEPAHEAGISRRNVATPPYLRLDMPDHMMAFDRFENFVYEAAEQFEALPAVRITVHGCSAHNSVFVSLDLYEPDPANPVQVRFGPDWRLPVAVYNGSDFDRGIRRPVNIPREYMH